LNVDEEIFVLPCRWKIKLLLEKNAAASKLPRRLLFAIMYFFATSRDGE
jgi:hypothetical protein